MPDLTATDFVGAEATEGKTLAEKAALIDGAGDSFNESEILKLPRFEADFGRIFGSAA